MRIPNLITGRTARLPGDLKSHPREPAGERAHRGADAGPLSREQPPDRPRAARVFTIRIPDWLPVPLNRLMGQHWGAASRAKKADSRIILDYADLHGIPQATEKRRVEVLVVLPKGKRAPDPDALWKSLLDALVRACLLVNDSHLWVEAQPVEYARGAKLATYITLQDL